MAISPGVNEETPEENEATPETWRVYEHCTEKWGEDSRWCDLDTRHLSDYRIYQFEVLTGGLVEVMVGEQPNLEILEVDVDRFNDPGFQLMDMMNLENRERSTNIERDDYQCSEYQTKNWLAIRWLRKRVSNILEAEGNTEDITICSSRRGYGLNLKGTNIHYEITHSEVQGCNLEGCPA